MGVQVRLDTTTEIVNETVLVMPYPFAVSVTPVAVPARAPEVTVKAAEFAPLATITDAGVVRAVVLLDKLKD